MPNHDITLSQAAGSAAFIIDRACDRSQILVSVKRNGNEWLSPIGWVGQEKGTLLDCRPSGEFTQIDIPEDYAAQLKTGDSLHVSCYELDFNQSLTWDASSLNPAVKPDKTSGTNLGKSASKSLFGRFKSTPDPIVPVEPISDVARRADEAQRAADDIRAQMEAAHAAKEAAHQRALDAARLAEEARKAEEARIEEMKRATLALEEAEGKRREELDRLEEERRAEEARRVEEARLAEEARKLEEARRRQAELREERVRLSEALEAVRQQREAVQSRVTLLSTEIKAAKRAALEKTEQVTAFKESLGQKSDDLSARQVKFDEATSKLQALQNKVKASENALHACTRESERMEAHVSKSQAAYEAAQRAADEAMARAKDMKSKAEAATLARGEIVERAKALKAENTAAIALISGANKDSEKARAHFDKMREKVTALETQYETLRHDEARLIEASKVAEENLSAAKADLQHVEAREEATKSAIALIDNGEDIDAVRTALETMPAPFVDTATAELAVEPAPRSRRRFGRRAAAAISAPAVLYAGTPKDIEGDATADADTRDDPAAISSSSQADIPAAANDEGRRQTYKALVASAAAIAVVAALGFGLSQMGPAEAKPKPITAKPAVETPQPVIDLKTIKAPEVETETSSNADMETPKMGESDADTVEQKVDLVPVSPDTELKMPKDTTVTDASLKKEVQKVAAKPIIQTNAPKSAIDTLKNLPKVEPKTQAAVQTIRKQIVIKPAAAPKSVIPKKTEKTKAVQTQLSRLGFYNGAIDGLTGSATDAAIVEFKTLFGMPKNATISTQFESALKQAIIDVNTPAPVKPQAVKAAETPVVIPRIAETKVVKAPVIDVTPEPEPEKTASLTPVSQPVVPIAQDVVVNAKRLNAISAQYPQGALRREFYETVTVVVVYDISEEGVVQNAKVQNIEGDTGSYRRQFERAGLKAVERQKFSPKTINNVPVLVENSVSRLKFQVQ